MKSLAHLLVIALLAICSACALPPPGEFGDQSGGKIRLETLSLPEAEFPTMSKAGETAAVWGELSLPRNKEGRVPAIVLAHGCGGVGPNLQPWADELNRVGFAALIVDSYGGRKLKETCTAKQRINLGSRVIDVYRAREFLAGHPRIDPDRIALMGFSQGGGTVLLARHTRFQRWTSGAGDFTAYLAFYPNTCNRKLIDESQVSNRPLRIFHGAADDWTTLGPCREYVERLKRTGKDVGLFVYPDAHHAFDNPKLPSARFLENVMNGSGCMSVEQANGQFIFNHAKTGKRVTQEAPCSSRGATVGHNPQAYRQAIQDVKTFLNAVFQSTQ